MREQFIHKKSNFIRAIWLLRVKVGKSIAGNEMPNTVIKDVQSAQIFHLQKQLESNISQWASVPTETLTAVVSSVSMDLELEAQRERSLRSGLTMRGCSSRVFYSSSQCDHD